MSSTQTTTVFQSQARTANLTSTEVSTQSATTVTFEINVTAITGTSVTFTVQDYDITNATWYTLLASAAISAAGRSRLTIGTTTATAANVGLNAVPPRRLRVVTTGTWNPATFDVVAQIHRT